MTAIRSKWEVAADLLDPPLDTALWKPWPKQRLASDLATMADMLLFGGAAGPGKTEWLMEHGIRQMEAHAGNRGVILRRVFPSLNRTIIPRLKVKLHGRATWNGQAHTFTFPNTSVLECGSLQYADDVLDFQGAEYGWMGFEEVTEFLQTQIEFMLSRLRAPVDGVRPHLCATTNPGGPGHGWVKRWFVKPKPEDVERMPDPGEIWSPLPTEANPTPGTRVFVPATHEDNPILLERDPGYLNRLRQISNRGLRLALEKGDWDAIDAVEGALWSQTDLDEGRISTEWFKYKVRSYRRVLAVDPSDGDEQGDEYGLCLASRGDDGRGYVEGSWALKGMSVRQMAQKTVNLYHEYGCSALVVEKNHGGKWMLEVFRQVDPTVNIVVVWASDGKRTRAEPVANLFEPIDGALITERYQARMTGFHPELEEELTTTTFEPGDPSPNRLDAMVWALTNLMLRHTQAKSEPGRDERLAGRR